MFSISSFKIVTILVKKLIYLPQIALPLDMDSLWCHTQPFVTTVERLKTNHLRCESRALRAVSTVFRYEAERSDAERGTREALRHLTLF